MENHLFICVLNQVSLVLWYIVVGAHIHDLLQPSTLHCCSLLFGALSSCSARLTLDFCCIVHLCKTVAASHHILLSNRFFPRYPCFASLSWSRWALTVRLLLVALCWTSNLSSTATRVVPHMLILLHFSFKIITWLRSLMIITSLNRSTCLDELIFLRLAKCSKTRLLFNHTPLSRHTELFAALFFVLSQIA